ncbi:MAG TPA: hypothetical protein ENL20_03755, partial [Candidatus Cloacimonetes bacterium]|nr:hypothetical protein [Candidatus Cloacimonadota bacterium]
MKKPLILFLLIFSTLFLFSHEIPQPVKNLKPIKTIKGKLPTSTRPVPDYEFLIEPTDLMTTYYDYMPGSYNGIPVQIQPPISQPNGYEAGGVYTVYHARQTTNSNKRLYFSYIDADGNLIETSPISHDIWAGYGSIDIDPVTADAFVVWHQSDGESY